MMSMIWKSAILLAHLESCNLMDQFVMMEEGSVLFLFLRIVLFLSSQTSRKRNA